MPSIGYPLLYSFRAILLSVGQNIAYGLFCALTAIGLILLIFDRKGFFHRMKGYGIASLLLAVFGLIMIQASFFWIISNVSVWNYYNTKIPGNPMTFEESIPYRLFEIWAILALISGVFWLFYGVKVWEYKTGFMPLKREIDYEEAWKKYPRDLFAKYVEQYPHNPDGVLEWHIHKKMKEGKTREQAIQELNK